MEWGFCKSIRMLIGNLKNINKDFGNNDDGDDDSACSDEIQKS